MTSDALAANEALVTLTKANIDHGHLYITSARHLLPSDVFGGAKRVDESPRPLTVTFDPGQTVQTDVPKGRYFFRERAAVADFYERTGAKKGDKVRIVRTAQYQLRVSMIAAR